MSGNSVYRERTKILVALFPGIHLRELQRALNISFNTARHHVDALFKSGELERENEGGYSRLYPVGTSIGDKLLFASSRSPTKRLILAALVRQPNLTNKQLSEITGLAKSTISEQIQSLTHSGIACVSIFPDSRNTYSLRDPVAVSRALSGNEQRLLDSVAERFINLWDF
jgi:predicted transcriptional regulator